MKQNKRILSLLMILAMLLPFAAGSLAEQAAAVKQRTTLNLL